MERRGLKGVDERMRVKQQVGASEGEWTGVRGIAGGELETSKRPSLEGEWNGRGE
jgi:hypothetical protein